MPEQASASCTTRFSNRVRLFDLGVNWEQLNLAAEETASDSEARAMLEQSCSNTAYCAAMARLEERIALIRSKAEEPHHP